VAHSVTPALWAKRRAHRRAQGFGVENVGRATQRDRPPGAERVRRADQRADVAGILDAVQHQQRAAPSRGNVRERPIARLDDRQHALGRVGRRQCGEGARGDPLDRHRAPREVGPQRRSPRGAVQLRRDQRAPKRESGAEGFLDEADTFDERQPTATPRFATLEIADGGLQITGYGSLPRTGRL